MTLLTGAIVSHNLEGIESAIVLNPSTTNERSNGWLPIELAEKTGNIVTFVRVARLINYALDQVQAEMQLKKYIALVTATEYESIPSDRAAEMVWSCVFNGASFKIDRWQRPLLELPKQVEDIHYLISKSEISSLEQLQSVVKNA